MLTDLDSICNIEFILCWCWVIPTCGSCDIWLLTSGVFNCIVWVVYSTRCTSITLLIFSSSAIGESAEPCKPVFFQIFFSQFINCLFICDDLLFFYFFIPQFKCLKIIFFILSSSLPGMLRSNLIAFLSFSCYLNWLERCTSIAKVRVPISARPEFFQPFFSQLLEVAYYSFQIKLSTFSD